MTWILCSCGASFWGVKGKEDTCPKCLKKLINPKGLDKKQEDHLLEESREKHFENKLTIEKEHKETPQYIKNYYAENQNKEENHF